MAFGAIIAKLAAMNVVAAMAAVAITRNCNDAIHGGLGMASTAIETFVRTVQQEIRLTIVIKAPQGPVERRVTRSAVIA